MIELVVTKNIDNNGAVSYKCKPTSVKFGNEADNGLNILHVEVPEDWEGKTIRVQFLSKKKKNEYRHVLDINNTCPIGSPITDDGGTFLVEALGDDDYIAHTNNVVYTIVDHIDVAGEDVVYNPSQIDEILRNAQQYVNEARDIVNEGEETISGYKSEAEESASKALESENASKEYLDQITDKAQVVDEKHQDVINAKAEVDIKHAETIEARDETLSYKTIAESAASSAESSLSRAEDVNDESDRILASATSIKSEIATTKTEVDNAATRAYNSASAASSSERTVERRYGQVNEYYNVIQDEYIDILNKKDDIDVVKVDILHYKDDAEASAQRAEQSAEEAKQDYADIDERKMERYVMRLVKNADNTYKFTSLEDEDLTFEEVYNVTKKLNEYVVVLYGNSKLRPQYVSTNEIMFIGVDRSTETKVLRILYTPTRLSYETFKLAESTDLNGYVKDTDVASGTKLGLIKTGNGLNLTSANVATAQTLNGTNYNSVGNSFFISKGTLEYVWSARHVTLTQAEYDALTTKDPKTEYNIVEE